MGETDDLDALLDEQISYYRAVAREYGKHAIPADGAAEVFQAFEALDKRGRVLELAPGTGKWTELLLRHAESITAVDSAPEMIDLARERVSGDPRVTFVQADLFSFEPDQRYDLVFFGFFISHVPLSRFADFWGMVGRAVAPGGRVFFVDDSYRTPEELIEGESSSTIERRLLDGTAFRAIKVPHRPEPLQERLERLGWQAKVEGSGAFYWGEATPSG